MKSGFPSRPTQIAFAVGAALSLAGTQALAQERAGRVLAATGTIVASTPGGGARTLSKGSRVYTGDTIDTHDGRIQIRFIDGALMTLQPATRFEVAEYEFHDPAQGDPDEGGSVLMRLFSGALRTITGIIGDDDDEAYRMETPVATIGVRGTQYALQFCEDGSCGDDVEDGLYGYVGDDRVWARNQGGSGNFGTGRFFKVRDDDQKPEGILEPPGDVLRGSVPEEEEADDIEDIDDPGAGGGDSRIGDEGAPGDTDGDESLPKFSEAEDTGVEVAEDTSSTGMVMPPPPFDGAVAGSLIGSTVSEGGVCISPSECTAHLDDNGNLVQLDSSFTSVDVGSPSTLAEFGTVPSLDATFGRWTGSGVGSDFVWAYSGNPTTMAELSTVFSTQGTLNFGTFDGPAAIDSNGAAWTVSNLSVVINFNSGIADVMQDSVFLDLSGPNSRNVDLANLNDTAVINPSAGDLGFTVLLDDPTPGSAADDGTLRALFLGDNADGLLIEFEARDADYSDTIRGVQILKQ